MDDAAAFRAESRRSWGAAAGGWGAHAPEHLAQAMPVTARMLDLADIQPGAELLELAAGTGDVGYMALELAQPGGTLIVSDFAPEMLTVAQERAAALGLRDVRFKQIDVESIDLAAGSLDVVLCRWGFMFAADPVAALREARRVLRPGGRLSLAAWTAAGENRWSSDMAGVMVERGHLEPTAPGDPGPFAWAREGLIAELLSEAGFVSGVEIDAVDFAFRQPFDVWWKRTTGMMRGAGAALARSDAAEVAAVRAAVYERLAEFESGGELVIPARSWVAAATA